MEIIRQEVLGGGTAHLVRFCIISCVQHWCIGCVGAMQMCQACTSVVVWNSSVVR